MTIKPIHRDLSPELHELIDTDYEYIEEIGDTVASAACSCGWRTNNRMDRESAVDAQKDHALEELRNFKARKP